MNLNWIKLIENCAYPCRPVETGPWTSMGTVGTVRIIAAPRNTWWGGPVGGSIMGGVVRRSGRTSWKIWRGWRDGGAEIPGPRTDRGRGRQRVQALRGGTHGGGGNGCEIVASRSISRWSCSTSTSTMRGHSWRLNGHLNSSQSHRWPGSLTLKVFPIAKLFCPSQTLPMFREKRWSWPLS